MTEKSSSNEERMVNELEEIAKALKTIRSELAKANACLTKIDGNLDLVNIDLPD